MKDEYFKRRDAAIREVSDLAAEYEEALKSGAGDKYIIVEHAAYGHLCAAFGITQIALSGVDGEAEPTPARMAEVLEYIRSLPVKPEYVFSEPGRRGAVQRLAAEIGAETMELDPFERPVDGAESYTAVMRRNLEALKAAFAD
jgi:zinc transport system substrate-binding protein